MLNQNMNEKINGFSYSVIQHRLLTDNISQIFLQATQDHSFLYEAGQYINVIHSHGEQSPLSIACAPNHHALEFHLFHPVENTKAQELLQWAQRNQTWTFTGPFGACTLKQIHPAKSLIFIADGTGFAPIKAMIESLLTFSCPMHLYWSMPKQEDFYLPELILQWKKILPHFKFTPIIVEANEKLVHVHDIILQDYADLSQHQVYASGPKRLIQTAFHAFQQQGLPQAFFYSDMLAY